MPRGLASRRQEGPEPLVGAASAATVRVVRCVARRGQSQSVSTRAAQMKSFSDKPPTSWVLKNTLQRL